MDSDASITQKLIAEIAVVSGIDPTSLTVDTELHDVGLDSILLALILRAAEVEFAVEFDDDEIADFLGGSSIGDYVGVVQRALKRAHKS